MVWWRVVDLPSYSVGPNGGASTSERGLTEFFAGDAWFCVIGLVVGLVIGILGWRLFAAVGWPVAVGMVVLGLLAALICWAVGYALGPGPFAPRLAAAQPGDLMPIELTVRATGRAGGVAVRGHRSRAARRLPRPRRRGTATTVREAAPRAGASSETPLAHPYVARCTLT